MPKIATVTGEDLSRVVTELRSIQRQRAVVIKSRIMQANRLQAIVAGDLGYDAKMEESDRAEKFEQATSLIDRINGGSSEDCRFREVILTTMIGINAFKGLQDDLEHEMISCARSLPVCKWVEQKEQLGFGIKSLGIVVGETGDLSNYANPAKVWRRMGCSPWTYQDAGWEQPKTLMGATWRSGKEGKLPAMEWSQYGYSPRRRSIMYVIGEGLIKQNYKVNKANGETIWTGPYRAKYQSAKDRAIHERPLWTACGCKGTGKVAKKGVKAKGNGAMVTCTECAGKGRKLKRCHLHAMLVASKLLLAKLWEAWNKGF